MDGVAEDTLQELAADSLAAWGLSASPAAVQGIVRHFLRVREENRRVNLMGLRHEPASVGFIRLSIDAMSAALVVDAGGSAVDLGSGAGYPGLPLALLHPSQSWTLVEATKKKAAFIERMVDELAVPNASVVSQRAEEWARKTGPRFSWATARAIGPLPLVAELAAPLLVVGGRVVAMRGPAGADEAQQARAALEVLGLRVLGARQFALPEGQGARTLVQLEKVVDTPFRFPRIGATLGRF